MSVADRRPRTHEAAGTDRRTGVETPERVAAVRASRLLRSDADEETFDLIAHLTATLLGASMAFLTVVDGHVSVVKGRAGMPEYAPRTTPARAAVCQLVVDAGREVVIPDVTADPRTRDLPAVAELDARAWIGLPITDTAGFVLGSLCAVDTEARRWADEEVAGLRGLVAVVARAVELRRIAGALQAYADQAEDLAVTLQEVLLPIRVPTVPGIRIATRFQPGGTGVEVLGDFYDVLVHDDGFSVVIGDVSGKGAAAARTASLVRSTVRAAASGDQDPVSVLTAVHEVLREEREPGRFVTVAYASFVRVGPDPSSGWDVVVCSAGHPPGFVVRTDGTVAILRAGGRVLGVTDDPVIDGDAFTLEAGESLVLYTDGVIESRDSLGTQLDEQGAQHALAAAAPDTEALADGLVAAARRHAGRVGDDLAVVVIGVR